MKKSVGIVVFLFICCGVGSTFSQVKSKPRYGIVLKVSVDDPNSDAYFISVNPHKVGSTRHEGGVLAKDYGPDYTGPALPPGYSYEWKATVIDKSRSRIKLWIRNVDDGRIVNGYAVGCNTRKEFFVRRNRRTKLHLGCRVKLVAYYGLEQIAEEQE